MVRNAASAGIMALFGSRSSGRGGGGGGEDDDPYNYQISTASKGGNKGRGGASPLKSGGGKGGDVASPSSDDVMGKAAAYLKKYSPGQQQQQKPASRSSARAVDPTDYSMSDSDMDSMDSFKDQRSRGNTAGGGSNKRSSGSLGSRDDYGGGGGRPQPSPDPPRPADPFNHVMRWDQQIEFLGITGVHTPPPRPRPTEAPPSSFNRRGGEAAPESTSPARASAGPPPTSYDSAFSKTWRPTSASTDMGVHDDDDDEDEDDESRDSSYRRPPSPPSSYSQPAVREGSWFSATGR